ncbi:hypothetical protein EP7_000985 [Isosphaeraceae bacterium EP7]
MKRHENAPIPCPIDGTHAAPRVEGAWSRPSMAAASALIAFHFLALLSAELAPPPSSSLVRAINDRFRPYLNPIHSNYAHRFYSHLDPSGDLGDSSRWSTPIIIAELEGGKLTEPTTLRFPEPGAWPHLKLQRQLALAFHLAAEPRWGASYARHLCSSTGCRRVRLSIREHSIPGLATARAAAMEHRRIAADDPSNFSEPRLIGDFRWGEF